MENEFFEISARSIVPEDWGDYGDVLQHGMTAHLDRVDGCLALERTGPYIPPITFPGIGDILLSSEGRRALETSGLSGFSFRPVKKVHITEFHWEDWDLTSKEPPHLPKSGEPEDYILSEPHSESAAAQMGDIWELVISGRVKVVPAEIDEDEGDPRLDPTTWDGSDLVFCEECSAILCTKRGRDWFLSEFGRYVEFDSFPAT